MKALWEELHSHRPLPNCHCPFQCKCDDVRVPKTYRVEDQIIQFLIGINDQFSVVKTQVLLMDHLPSLNKVFSLSFKKKATMQLFLIFQLLKIAMFWLMLMMQESLKGVVKDHTINLLQDIVLFCNKHNHTIDLC